MPSVAHDELVQFFVDNPTPTGASMADRRVAFDEWLLSMPVGDDVRVSAVSADGVPVDWVMAHGARSDRVVLLLHGGGCCMGSARTYREFASRISRASGTKVAAVDYRLAPESPFPAALDDAFAAYRWLLGQGLSANNIGLAAQNIVVVGDSGGVGLSLAVVARARDAGLEVPAGVVGFAPWIDLAVGETIAEADDIGDPILTPEVMRLFARHYLQDHSPRDPSVNLLYGDLHDFPPLLLLAATRDIGYGDSLRLARHAREADVAVTVRTYHGLMHNWQLACHLPEAADAIATAAEFMDQQLRDEILLTEEYVR